MTWQDNVVLCFNNPVIT